MTIIREVTPPPQSYWVPRTLDNFSIAQSLGLVSAGTRHFYGVENTIRCSPPPPLKPTSLFLYEIGAFRYR